MRRYASGGTPTVVFRCCRNDAALPISDWVATVPPTVALCRERFGLSGPIVFGWVFASHQIGAAIAAFGAGFARDHLDTYDLAWYVAGALCAAAAVMSIKITSARTAGAS